MGKVELSISGNSRLLVGVAGAVNHVGEAAGLGDKARGDLVAAVEQACHEALDQAADKQARVALSLEVLPGKIEAVLQYPTAPRAVGASERALLAKLDDVKREVNGNSTRLTLIKKI
jgi:hypothetical protein